MVKELINGWNWDLSQAPHNTRILVENGGADTWATFDPTWGKGRGAWFDDKNKILTKVWCWQTDTEAYLARRPKGPHVVPIK
jgi:hypothetical protein